MDEMMQASASAYQEQTEQPRKPKPKKSAKQPAAMSTAALQLLFKSLHNTEAEERQRIEGMMQGSSPSYLAQNGEIYAVLLSPAAYDKLLRASK